MANEKAKSKNGQYEAMFLFGAGAATANEESMATIRRIIESHGGEVLVLKKWEERKLAYEVGGNKRGIYYLSLFRAPGGAVAQIERDVKLSEEVLRVIVLSADHLSADEIQAQEPQKPEPREERPERGFGGFGGGGYGGGGGGYGDRGDRGGDRGDRGERPDRGPRPPRREEPAPAGAEKPE